MPDDWFTSHTEPTQLPLTPDHFPVHAFQTDACREMSKGRECAGEAIDHNHSILAMPAKKKAAPATPLPTKKAKSKPVAHDALEPLEKVASITTRRLPLTALKPHPRNPRKHPDPGSPEWDVLKASLEYDYFDPIVWNERNGQLVSGHLRTKVLKSINFTHADVVVVNYDEPTHIARLMAANKAIGENDLPKMKELFVELKGLEGFDMAVAGFTLPEVDDWMAQPEVQQDTDPAVSVGPDHAGTPTAESEEGKARLLAVTSAIGKPKTEVKVGTCWKVGPHVLFCQPLVSGPWKWAELLARLQHKAKDKKVVFIPCPDPYVLLSEKDIIIVAVQPDAFVAGHAVSNYAATHGKATVTAVPNPDTLWAK